MEKNQKKLQNLFFIFRKKSSTLTVISIFFLFSVFSFLLIFNQELYQIFFKQFNHLKHFLDKKAIFCFFNAILLFVAKSSGVLASSIEQPPVAAGLPGRNFGEKSQFSLAEKISVKKNQQLLLAEEIDMELKEVGKMKPALMEGDCILEEEEEEEVVGEMEELGIDELNKKFEEFIVRIRKEIKMEAL